MLDDPDLTVLHRVADEVARRLARTTDWGESGERPGQYLADVAADEIALDLLLDAGFAVLSEESGRSGDGDRIVVLDPLDGSTNASRRIPWYATSMCLVDDHGPAVALVVNQASGDRLAAVRGKGAWLGEQRLACSRSTELATAILGISGLPPSTWGWQQFRAFGAVALDLGLVAAGSLDGFVDISVDAHGSWDYLGGALLVTEAGGLVVDAFDRDLVVLGHDDRRTPIAAATPALLDALLERRRSIE